MKQILRIHRIYGKDGAKDKTKEYVVVSQEDIDNIVETYTRGEELWEELVLGKEIVTGAYLQKVDWYDPSGVSFCLLNPETAISMVEDEKKYSDKKIAKYKTLVGEEQQ